jgi:hypothetical protein
MWGLSTLWISANHQPAQNVTIAGAIGGLQKREMRNELKRI